MKPSSQKPVSMVLAVWIVALVIWVILYGLTLFPQQRRLEQVRRQIAVTHQTIEALQALTSPERRQEIQQAYNEVRSRLDQLVFDRDSLAHFDFTVRDMVSASNLAQFNSRSRLRGPHVKVATSSPVRTQQISMSAQCDFPGFLRFLNALERHQPAAWVTDFTLNRNYDSDKQSLAYATFEVSLYRVD